MARQNNGTQRTVIFSCQISCPLERTPDATNKQRTNKNGSKNIKLLFNRMAGAETCDKRSAPMFPHKRTLLFLPKWGTIFATFWPPFLKSFGPHFCIRRRPIFAPGGVQFLNQPTSNFAPGDAPFLDKVRLHFGTRRGPIFFDFQYKPATHLAPKSAPIFERNHDKFSNEAVTNFRTKP